MFIDSWLGIVGKVEVAHAGVCGFVRVFSFDSGKARQSLFTSILVPLWRRCNEYDIVTNTTTTRLEKR
jgi:hypothetical protein